MSEIELKHVGKNYGSVNVLIDISLEMGDGEFVVLVGPSGCGKSTLLRMIAGLEDITSGEITIGGKVINNMPAKERDLAMVFQSYALYPHMKVADNMSFALKLAGTPRAEIKKLHQRLGKTMVYVTHDQTEAMTMADKIVVLNGGRIEQAGAPLELYNNPANLFVASFIGSPEINLFEATYQGGTDVALRNGVTLPLGSALDIPAGTAIVYGVRPQHITLAATGVPADVIVVEPTGDAQEVLARIGDEDISIVVRDHAPLSLDRTIHLHIDPQRLLIFDRSTGLRLR